MGNKGVMVMLNMIYETYGQKNYEEVLGKTISGIELDPDYNDGDGGLIMSFNDGAKIALYDNGRSCCESRYMITSDDMVPFIGAVFNGIEINDAPPVGDEYGDHEVQFMVVRTSLGSFTMETHNEHNGYYGGFSVSCNRIA